MKNYTLANGIQVVTEHIPSTRSVAFGIWVKTGSRSESTSNNGMTHFIEHMLFKGTSRYTAKEIADIFDGLGGNINAFTSKENTCYYFIVLDQHFPRALEVLADMFFNSCFDHKELKKEKKVISEEIAMYEDTPDDLVHDLIARAAFADHPLAQPILGTHQTLSNFNSNHLQAFMKDHYTPNQIVISIAGNFDDTTDRLVESYFASYTHVVQPHHYIAPTFQGNYLYHQKQTEQNHLCLALPGLPLQDERIFTMNILNNMIGGGMSSHLFQEIREQRGLAYSVYSYHTSFSDSGLFVIYAGTAPEQTIEVLETTIHVIDSLLQKGVTQTELNRAKEQLKGNFILSSESSSSRMHRMGRNQLMLGKQKTIDQVLESIDAVTSNELQQLMEQLFRSPFAIALVGNAQSEIESFRRDSLVVSN